MRTLESVFGGLLLTLVAAAALLPAAAVAQVDTKNQGYLVDPKFDVVTSSTTQLCWRTSDWTPARAAAAASCRLCTPELCPKPAVAAAPPPPVIVPPPPPLKPEPKEAPKVITFSADALFDFDKSSLRPDGRTLLDNLVRQLDRATYNVIIVIGHTDRIGSAAYNQKLSERRAGTVKDYLVERGIPADVIRAEGRGKTQPLTHPGDCRNSLPRARLIACLQMDRRVDIDVH
jgi:OmpA-OmpF porin, OOP family